MILSVEVRLRGTFLVAVSSNVLALKNVAVFNDHEPGFVRSPRRPDDLWLMSLRIETAVVEHVEFDKRTAESDAAGETMTGVVRNRDVGNKLLSVDRRLGDFDRRGLVLRRLNEIGNRIWQ